MKNSNMPPIKNIIDSIGWLIKLKIPPTSPVNPESSPPPLFPPDNPPNTLPIY